MAKRSLGGKPFACAVVTLLLAASAGATPPAKTPIAISLRSDIIARKNASFTDLLARWQKSYGPKAVDPLFDIAADSDGADADRYVALMGAAKLGGTATSARVAQFLQDKSWMLRTGALRLLGAFRDESVAPSVLPLLRDPALVVRLEAVSTVEKLRPTGAPEALLAALNDRANYHGGKALWVPERALQALATLRAREIAPRLLPLLDHTSDPRLLERTVATLDSLSGRSTTLPGAPGLKARVDAWKAELSEAQSDSLTDKSAAPVRRQVDNPQYTIE